MGELPADDAGAPSFESVSTWQMPEPPFASATRAALVASVAAAIDQRSPKRLRVAIDGPTGAGKTSFGHELATALRRLGRPTLRASLDDFKHPWRDATERGYDRLSGEGYYRNAYDFESATELLLKPAGPQGSGRVVLCAHDPLTGVDRRDVVVTAPDDAILIVDSVFALRPQYAPHWDFTIFLEVRPEVALSRGVERDAASEGREAATDVHLGRYRVAEEIYLAAVHPKELVDLVIDNDDFANPWIVPVTTV